MGCAMIGFILISSFLLHMRRFFTGPHLRINTAATAILSVLYVTTLCLPAMADCKTHYEQSRQLLDSTLQKSKEPNAKTDAEAFESSFKEAVKRLQTDKCLPELMNLIQHIQSEQQKHPRSSQNKPAPIVD